MPPSAASKRFRSATAAVQGRGVASKRKPSTPSITSLVPDVLQATGPRISVAAKRNIFMHARAYLHGQSRAKDVNERKILVQSVIEGTRLHQKQGEAVTSMQEHMVEQQEERRSKEVAALAAAAVAAAQLGEPAEPEAEQEYHAANSTLTSVGFLHSQVAKLEALSKSYQDASLVMTAVSSAQKCVSVESQHRVDGFMVATLNGLAPAVEAIIMGLLTNLRSQVQDDEEMLKHILEAQRTGAAAKSSLLRDLEGELARMREALNSAKALQETSAPEVEEVLELVGSIYEDMQQLQLPSVQLHEASEEARLPVNSSRSGDLAVESVPALSEFSPRDPETAELEVQVEAPTKVEELQVEQEMNEGNLVEDVEDEVDEVEDEDKSTLAVSEPATPRRAEAALAEVTNAAEPLEPQVLPVADRTSGLPRLPSLETAGTQDEAAAEIAEVPVEKALPNIGREAVQPQAAEVDKPMGPPDLPVEPRMVPPVPVAPSTEKVEKVEVKKVRRKLVMAPDIRLPALPSRNRKKTADLDWNMEHLNADELDLLNEVITEDGSRAAPSIVCDPKKERLWKQFWGLQDSPRVQAAAAAALAPRQPPQPFPPVPRFEMEEELRPQKVRTLPELSVSEKTPRSGRARIVRAS